MNSKADEHRAEPVTRALLAIAGLLGAFIFLKVATFYVRAAEADGIVAQAKPTGLDESGAASPTVHAIVDGLKKNNLFAPPAPKQYPISGVAGILGDQALINGQWYRAGDTVAEAKIMAIEPTRVRIAWNGQEKEFAPMSSEGAGGPQEPGPKRKSGPPTPGGARMVVTSGAPGAGPGAVADGGGEDRDRSGEMRERWKNMSPEERQKYREQTRAQLGRRGR